MNSRQHSLGLQAILPDPGGGFGPCPTVTTEEELVRFLRIPEISTATDYQNVIWNLKRAPSLFQSQRPVAQERGTESWSGRMRRDRLSL